MPCKFCSKNIDFVEDDRDYKGVYHGKDDGMVSYISGKCQDLSSKKAKDYLKRRSERRKELGWPE